MGHASSNWRPPTKCLLVPRSFVAVIFSLGSLLNKWTAGVLRLAKKASIWLSLRLPAGIMVRRGMDVEREWVQRSGEMRARRGGGRGRKSTSIPPHLAVVPPTFQQWMRLWWMTSCLHNMGHAIGQNQARRHISKHFARWRYQLDVRQLQCLVEFIRMRHRGRGLLSTTADVNEP